MIRSCNFFIDDEVVRKKKIRVCLDYHIRKCEGPCEGLVSQERYNEMIQQVGVLLGGKTGALKEKLHKEMTLLAAEMRFEDAALLRDRIRGLEAYSERQKVVDLNEKDRDLAAFAVEGDDACGVIFKIREGRLIGRHHYYMTGVDGKEEPEIMEGLINQYYLTVDDVPPEILAGAEVENKRAVEDWLTTRRGGRVVLSLPSEGEDAKLIRLTKNNARFLLDDLKLQRLKRKEIVPHAVQVLQRDLRLRKLPGTIECFDISNIQGKDPAASLVVFVDGKPRKSEYRKFRIRSVSGPDDFASMREVVQRRYRRMLEEGKELPDLIMVDGGKGQLSSALEALSTLEIEGQQIIGLAKKLEEIFFPGAHDPIILPKASAALRLLQRIRDEAHRFAVTYHRTLRSKRTLTTELDLIEGIGKVRAKELLEVFGSVQGVKFATEEQLGEIVGTSVAAKIRGHFEVGDESIPHTNDG
jgi:excinuclease ABC subunit C